MLILTKTAPGLDGVGLIPHRIMFACFRLLLRLRFGSAVLQREAGMHRKPITVTLGLRFGFSRVSRVLLCSRVGFALRRFGDENRILLYYHHETDEAYRGYEPIAK
jgi:hypothetical protein